MSPNLVTWMSHVVERRVNAGPDCCSVCCFDTDVAFHAYQVHADLAMQRSGSGSAAALRANFLLVCHTVVAQDGHLLADEELSFLDQFKVRGSMPAPAVRVEIEQTTFELDPTEKPTLPTIRP